MRTTVTLEPDVERFVREEAHRTKRPFKAVINDLLRRAMRPERGARPRPFKVTPHKTRLVAGIEPARFNQLADELEDDELLGRMTRR